MNISKSELLKILGRLSAEIKLNCVDNIEIKDIDFYWDITSKELYNPYEEPILMLGQISDDWMELKRILKDDSISFSYDLKRISVIFRLLEHEIGADWLKQIGDAE